jgi:hypothetical protein
LPQIKLKKKMTGFIVLASIVLAWIRYELNNVPTIGNINDSFSDGMGRDEYGNPVYKD